MAGRSGYVIEVSGKVRAELERGLGCYEFGLPAPLPPEQIAAVRAVRL
jgi:hypothetical protein